MENHTQKPISVEICLSSWSTSIYVQYASTLTIEYRWSREKTSNFDSAAVDYVDVCHTLYTAVPL